MENLRFEAKVHFIFRKIAMPCLRRYISVYINCIVVFLLTSGPGNVYLNLTMMPSEVLEGKTTVMECIAYTSLTKAKGFFTWKMKGQVASNGERIRIDTSDGPDESAIVSRLTLSKSSWKDNGRPNS